MPELVAEDVAKAFDRLAPTWDTDHGPRSRRRLGFALRTALLRDLLRRKPRRHVLDVGCGTGQYLLALEDLIDRGLGIDISPGMVLQARLNAGGRLGAPDRLRFEALPIERLSSSGEGPFDLVVFFGSLEHMADPARAVEEAARALRADGLIAVATPHPAHPRRLLVRRALRRGTMPPLQPLNLGMVRLWAEQGGLAQLGPVRRALSSRSWSGSLWWLAATLKGVLTGNCILVFQRQPVDRRATATDGTTTVVCTDVGSRLPAAPTLARRR